LRLIKPHADQYPTICEKALLEKGPTQILRIGAETAKRVYDSGHLSIEGQFAGPMNSALRMAAESMRLLRNGGWESLSATQQTELGKLLGAHSALNEAQDNITRKLPQIDLTPEGHLLTTTVQGHEILFVVRSHEIDGQLLRVMRVPKPEWFSHVIRISPDANYVVIASERFRLKRRRVAHIRIISLVTGKTIIEREESSAIGSDAVAGYDMTFDQTGQTATLWAGRSSQVEVFGLNGDTAKVIGAWNLGTLIRDPTQGTFGFPIMESLIGQIYYRPDRSLLAFYEGFAPLILNLQGSGYFQRLFFEEAPVPPFVPREPDEKTDQTTTNFLNTIGALTFSEDGAISRDFRLMAVKRYQGGADHTNTQMVDIYDMNSMKLLRTFSVSELIRNMVFSPDGRYLALSFAIRKNYVHIYDLRSQDNSKSLLPAATIDFPIGIDELLAFPSNDTLIAGNKEKGVVFKTHLSELPN